MLWNFREALAIIGEFDSLHWYCQPCDVDMSKIINTGLPSNTMQDAQLAIGQQIEVLHNQLTGLMTKFNDHINFCFQQLENVYNYSGLENHMSLASPTTNAIAMQLEIFTLLYYMD